MSTGFSKYQKKAARVAPSSHILYTGDELPRNCIGIYDAAPAQIATSLRADEASARTRILLNQRAAVAVWFGFGGYYYCCGYSVSGLQLQEADALGISSRLADCG